MDFGTIVYETIRSEFSDVPDVAQLTRIVLRMVVAALLGGVLGFERESQGKSAGLRTHMLVALGSTIFVFVPQQIGISDTDLTRVLQGLVAGIGFLGAGTIVKSDREEDVRGLTTAASIWMTAAIGVAVGLGREATAVLSTALALVILAFIPKFAGYFQRNSADKNPGARKLHLDE